jgi:hypothetical protein
MIAKKDNIADVSPSPSNSEILDILSEAQAQYERYVELASFSIEETTRVAPPVKRDINYPLGLVLK